MKHTVDKGKSKFTITDALIQWQVYDSLKG